MYGGEKVMVMRMMSDKLIMSVSTTDHSDIMRYTINELIYFLSSQLDNFNKFILSCCNELIRVTFLNKREVIFINFSRLDI